MGLTWEDVPPPVVGAEFIFCDLERCDWRFYEFGVEVGVLGPTPVDFCVILIPEFDGLLWVGRFGLLGPDGMSCHFLCSKRKVRGELQERECLR